MRKINLNVKNIEIFGFVIAIGIIVLFTFWDFNRISGPFVLDDEFGYWSIAASLAGLNWKDFISYCSY